MHVTVFADFGTPIHALCELMLSIVAIQGVQNIPDFESLINFTSSTSKNVARAHIDDSYILNNFQRWVEVVFMWGYLVFQKWEAGNSSLTACLSLFKAFELQVSFKYLRTFMKMNYFSSRRWLDCYKQVIPLAISQKQNKTWGSMRGKNCTLKYKPDNEEY